MMVLSRKYAWRWAVLLMTASVLNGCGEDEVPDVEPELRDHWEMIDLSGSQLSFARAYNVHFAGDAIYLFQAGSSRIYYHCDGGSGTWQKYELETEFLMGTRFLRATDTDGTQWVLTERSISQITGCGEDVTYSLAEADSLYQPWGIDNRFVGFHVHEGIPWLLHRQHGLYRYDAMEGVLIHHPVGLLTEPYWAIEQIPPFNSMAMDINGIGWLWIANDDGQLWAYEHETGQWYALEDEQKYVGLLTDLDGNMYAARIGHGMVRMPGTDSSPVYTQVVLQSPYYFTSAVFDREGRLAYYSVHTYQQPYIGLQKANGTLKAVNTQHAVEEGNVIVHHIGFAPDNTLYAATDRGLLRYLGSDE